jgi:hypothetical protein
MTTATYLLTLPADGGTNGQFLTTNGGTAVSWTGATAKTIQMVYTQTGAFATGSTVIPFDNTIPQNTEGDQYMTLSITPTSSSSKLRITACFNGSGNGVNNMTMALFQDSTASALSTTTSKQNAGSFPIQLIMDFVMTAGTTSSTTFKIRVGAGAAVNTTTSFNGRAGARIFGGVYGSFLIIQEYTP